VAWLLSDMGAVLGYVLCHSICAQLCRIWEIVWYMGSCMVCGLL